VEGYWAKINPATSTANITLYYLQSEFNEFNTKASDSGHKLLPTGPADATGISNLVLRQFHGTGTNPGNYTGSTQDFTTVISGFTVIWNATRSWWEVTVPVNGFSGFYITSAPASVLPITLEYFKGVQFNNKHVLNWKVNCTSSQAIFEIQRSGDGQHYNTIGNITANQLRCSQPFDYTDDAPLSGMNYYRIKVIDPDDKSYFTNTISFKIKTSAFEIVSLSPNPVTEENAILKINAVNRTAISILISDIYGRTISNEEKDLQPGANQVILNSSTLPKGAYQVTIYALAEIAKTLKFIKQ